MNEAEGYLLAVAAILVIAAGFYSAVAAFVTGDWRWLTVTLVAYLIMRRT